MIPQLSPSELAFVYIAGALIYFIAAGVFALIFWRKHPCP